MGPMPRPRFFHMPADARGRLLDLAMKEFADRGYDDASLNDILAKAGISKGAYYYYFDDKEDLFATAIEQALDAMLERMPLPELDELTAEQFWPAVERSVGQWVKTLDPDSHLLRATFWVTEERRRSPRFAAVLAKGRALWSTLVDAGQRVGCVRTDIPKPHLIRLIEANDAVLDAIFFHDHPKLSRAAFEKHLGLVLDTFKRLLAVGPTTAAPRLARRRRARG
jgi:AcrR family transcriptional regulator